ncbi:MAG: ABC transporter ATP-binding protein [Chloroflexi bacterium]|nr:ABC transporter ATP-binding protein [Chloroflexota bacterium]
MFTLDNVSKIYTLSRENAVHAVQEVSTRIQEGEFVVITGRSGSGKTTLLNLAAGLTRPTRGNVMLNGNNLWQMPDRQQSLLRNKNIGFIFQFPSLLPSLNALDNVILPTTFRETGADKGTAARRAAELLETVGLSDKLHAFPRQLSAGQQQRVVIARALINQPSALLADEPTSNLDEQTEREIMELFRQIHQARHITMVMVTHASQLASYGTRAIEMAAGKILNGG